MLIEHYEKQLYFAIFPLMVLIDCINGYSQLVLGIHTPIGIIYRSCIFLCIISSFFRPQLRWLKTYTHILIILMIIIPLLWASLCDINALYEYEKFTRIVYFISFITFYINNQNKININLLLKYAQAYGVLISILIVFSFFTGIGVKTYSEDYGFGTKFFFKAGNDLGLTLVFTHVLCQIIFFRFNRFIDLIAVLLNSLALFFVGSRVAMTLGIVLSLYFLVCLLFCGKKQNIKPFYLYFSKVILFGGVIFILFFPLSSFIDNTFDSYTINRFSIESLENARTRFTEVAITHIEKFDSFSFMFGEGAQQLFRFISVRVGAIADYQGTEADIYEFIGSYGFIFGGYILYFFYFWGYKSIRLYVKYPTLENSYIVILLVSFLIIGAYAGHAISNSMISPIYGVIILLSFRSTSISTSKRSRVA